MLRLVETLRALKHRFADPLLPRRRVGTVTTLDGDVRPGRVDILCLAICDWRDRWQRPQQLMSRFAAAGHRVFFAAPGARVDVDSDDAVIVVQHPMWTPLALQLRERRGWKIVYDCMDLHSGFATSRRAELRNENALLEKADVVIVSSSLLERHARRRRNDVVVVRNGCDYEHFAKAPRARNTRPVIGYHGAIAEWFDSGLVAALARRRPEWDFLLIGSTWSGTTWPLAKLPNVTLAGEQPYAALPQWLGTIDVCIIPFKRTPLTEATNPVKVYEMLAAGRPVVSVPIPEVAAIVPMVRVASTVDEFEREISEALRDDRDEERRAFARGQTWDRRFEAFYNPVPASEDDTARSISRTSSHTDQPHMYIRS